MELLRDYCIFTNTQDSKSFIDTWKLVTYFLMKIWIQKFQILEWLECLPNKTLYQIQTGLLGHSKLAKLCYIHLLSMYKLNLFSHLIFLVVVTCLQNMLWKKFFLQSLMCIALESYCLKLSVDEKTLVFIMMTVQ